MLSFNDYLGRVRELNPAITVREAGLGDGGLFVALYNNHYNRKTSIEYYRWQFFNSPIKTVLFMAFDSHKLVGYYGVKCYTLTGGISSGFAIDFLIDGPYRKTGIAFLLEAEVAAFSVANKIKVLTALPNAYGSAAFKAMGWKPVARIDGLIIDNLNSFHTGSIDGIAGKTFTGSKIEFVKDHEYRKWRFDENPIYKYETIRSGENNFAVTKLFIDPVTGIIYGDIVDIEFNNDGEIFRLLLGKIIESMKNRSVQMVTIWALPHTLLNKFLTNAGFRSVEQPRYFCLKVLDPEYAHVYEIDRWNLVQADSEVF